MASSLISGRPTSLAGVGNKPNALVPAGGEFYDCVRFCAMFDKPYIARYERKAGKVFQLVGTFKDIETAGPGNGKHSRVSFTSIRSALKHVKSVAAGAGKQVGLSSVFTVVNSSFARPQLLEASSKSPFSGAVRVAGRRAS